jgi:hypothetical protein
VFVRQADNLPGTPQWLFKEGSPESSSESQSDEAFWSFPEEQLPVILDIVGFLEWLREVAPDHPEAPRGSAADLSHPDLLELPEWTKRFLDDPQVDTLTVSIRYTNQGFGLTRLPDDTGRLLLFVPERVAQEQQRRAREICAVAGLTTHEDYTFNGGRTRILSYPSTSSCSRAGSVT